MSESSPQFAVVTSTIGRETLHKTIQSVLAQTVACKHYVFVHGREHWEKTQVILTQYPSVEGIYLPNNNGANGYAMAPVYALAPYVVSEAIMGYLDDDNWFEPEHCAQASHLINTYQLAWTFCMRKIVANDGRYLCEDDCESIGVFQNIYNTFLVDNSCFVLKTETARQHANAWYIPRISDRTFLAELMKHQLPCACTGESTANYRLSADGSHSMNVDAFVEGNQAMQQRFPDGFPWRRPTLFNIPVPVSA
jgi:hypothetical protein